MKHTLKQFFKDALRQQAIPEQYITSAIKEWDRFSLLASELKKWCKRVNLTAIKEDRQIVIKHFVDSLSLLVLPEVRQLASPNHLIDIGTGAGFPGIPLALTCNPLPVVLVESMEKKVRFLHHIIDLLGLKNVEIIRGRAEALAKDPHYRASFDLAVTRAIGKLKMVVEYAIPLLKRQGYIIAMKGPSYEEELKRAQRMLELIGGKVERIERKRLEYPEKTFNQRVLMVIKKIKATPDAYPRRGGRPFSRRAPKK